MSLRGVALPLALLLALMASSAEATTTSRLTSRPPNPLGPGPRRPAARPAPDRSRRPVAPAARHSLPAPLPHTGWDLRAEALLAAGLLAAGATARRHLDRTRAASRALSRPYLSLRRR